MPDLNAKSYIGCVGLVFKKGKFSATEEVQLNAAIERYKSVSRLVYAIRAQVLKHHSAGERDHSTGSRRACLFERARSWRDILARDQ